MSFPSTNRAESVYFAQPYNLDATGFYFSSYEEYQQKSTKLKDSFGFPVEEFELQYIDGEQAALFNALKINQATLEQWFDECEDLDSYQTIIVTYLAENGYDLDEALSKAEDCYLYDGPASDYAYDLFQDCEDLPEHIERYIDYDAVARDMLINGEIHEIEHNVILVGYL